MADGSDGDSLLNQNGRCRSINKRLANKIAKFNANQLEQPKVADENLSICIHFPAGCSPDSIF
jgi:hypothetical protein